MSKNKSEQPPAKSVLEKNVLIFVENESKNKPAGERYSYAEVCDLIYKYVWSVGIESEAQKDKKIEYWKKRCEAAEENIRTYSEWQDEQDGDDNKEYYHIWQEALKKWQQLKQLLNKPDQQIITEGL